jgi:hypothetical protein
MNRIRRAALLVTVCTLCFSGAPLAQDLSAALPEYEPFLKAVRQKLHSDKTLLSQYTYNVRTVTKTLDGKGKVKKIEEEVSEKYPSIYPGLSYSRVIMRNRKPVPKEEIAKEDRKHEKRLKEYERKLVREGINAREQRLANEEKARREEESVLNELFALFEIRMLGREMPDGVPSILLEFTPRPGFETRTDEGKILKKVAGRAWISALDHEVVRIEARLIENFGLGGGILARLNKGAMMTFQRRKVNDEIWLPAQAHFNLTGRLLLLKSVRVDVTGEFTEYRKFTVETNVIIRR